MNEELCPGNKGKNPDITEAPKLHEYTLLKKTARGQHKQNIITRSIFLPDDQSLLLKKILKKI